MRRAKTVFAFTLIAMLSIGLFFYFKHGLTIEGKKSVPLSKLKSVHLTKGNDSMNESVNSIGLMEKLKKACPELKTLEQNNFEKASKETLARNLHFKRGGEIFRLRLFLEDGKEGTFEKLILLKENAEGFPVIQKIAEQDQINPSKEVWEKYLKGGEIIYKEIDQRLSIGGREVTFTHVNGKLVKAVSSAGDCFFEER